MTPYNLTDLRKAARFLLASSVKSTFPDAQLAGGGSTPLGFYYDFVFPFEFQSSFLVLIEEGISRLIKEKKEFDCREMVPFSAKELLLHRKELYRAEDATDSKNSLITVVRLGTLIDISEEEILCQNTSDVGSVKLKSFEKVGKRQKKDVVRIWGAADFDKQRLKQFLKEEESLVKRCHPAIGQELQLFSPVNTEGSLWLWHPRGEALLQTSSSFLRQNLEKKNFSFVNMPSPDVLFFSEDREEEPLSPELLVERASLASQFSKEKISEVCQVWNKDLTDFSCGLLKTQISTYDIQYIFCSEKQLFEECISSLLFISKMLKILGFELKIVLSVRKVKPSAYTNDERICEEALKKALESLGAEFTQQTHSSFKGAKLELLVSDALGREWSTGFIQVSFPETNGKPALIVSSTFGSIERMIALMLEKSEGIPFLLAPEQVRIIALGQSATEYAYSIQNRIRLDGFRCIVEIASSKEKENLHKRLLEKIPFLIILGDKEVSSSTVRLRVFSEAREETVSLDELTLRLNRHKQPE